MSIVGDTVMEDQSSKSSDGQSKECTRGHEDTKTNSRILLGLMNEDEVKKLHLSSVEVDDSEDEESITVDDEVQAALSNRPGLDISVATPISNISTINKTGTNTNISISAAKLLVQQNLNTVIKSSEGKFSKLRKQGRQNIFILQ